MESIKTDATINSNKTPRVVSDLPTELQLRIIQDMVIPQQPCVEHVFGRCPVPMLCNDGHHSEEPLPLKPDFSLSGISKLFYEEGCKAFYENNIFVFNQTNPVFHKVYWASDVITRLAQMLPHETGLWKRARDMRAWHLLDFEDRDEIHSSLERRSGYPYRAPKRFRELTRHLVICVHNRDWRLQQCDWDWPLKIVWNELPNLETLYLDLRSYSRRRLCFSSRSIDEYDRRLAAGAAKMECLNLKRLVLIGLCSGEYWQNARHKSRMEKLFGNAVAEGIKIEFWDWNYLEFWDWNYLELPDSDRSE